MGFIVNTNIESHVFILNGHSSLLERRRKAVIEHGGTCVSIEDRLITAQDLVTLGREEVDKVIDGIFIVPNDQFCEKSLIAIVSECKRLRIPVNVTERPDLCTFTLPSLYEDGPFQLAVCTNGMGCRLANRLRRNITSSLPKDIGAICSNLGELRRKYSSNSHNFEDDDCCAGENINKLVLEKENNESAAQKSRWLLQMIEYFPFDKLRNVTDEDLKPVESKEGLLPDEDVEETKTSKPEGRISLVGAGPGSSKLLTTEALELINSADYILADKLIPEEVLSLIPRQTPVFIARKFPGNASAAQQELLNIGLQQLKLGNHVVRLKQGDPYIYGRGLEEVVFFKEHGYTAHVVAGISSALSAPLEAGISLTYRSVASEVLICTGTGRSGDILDIPPYVETRTTVFLMTIHRLRIVTDLLIENGWSADLPAVIIERASCSDQRIIRSTLKDIADASDELRSNPPGLLVVGRVCDILHKLNGQRWIVD